MSQAIPFFIVVVAALAAFAAGVFVARRRRYLEQSNAIVRCRRGHLFETLWMPRFSFRMLHLGWGRVQRCPVDGHLTLVLRVDENRLSAEEKKAARRLQDEFLRRK